MGVSDRLFLSSPKTNTSPAHSAGSGPSGTVNDEGSGFSAWKKPKNLKPWASNAPPAAAPARAAAPRASSPPPLKSVAVVHRTAAPPALRPVATSASARAPVPLPPAPLPPSPAPPLDALHMIPPLGAALSSRFHEDNFAASACIDGDMRSLCATSRQPSAWVSIQLPPGSAVDRVVEAPLGEVRRPQVELGRRGLDAERRRAREEVGELSVDAERLDRVRRVPERQEVRRVEPHRLATQVL